MYTHTNMCTHITHTVCWRTSIATALRRQRQEDHHKDAVSYLVHASLVSIVKPSSKIKYNSVFYKLKKKNVVSQPGIHSKFRLAGLHSETEKILKKFPGEWL